MLPAGSIVGVQGTQLFGFADLFCLELLPSALIACSKPTGLEKPIQG
jgi:hypothetical protein